MVWNRLKLWINGKEEHVKGVNSGYYDRNHYDKLIADIAPFDGKASGIYTTLHNCKDDLMGRSFNKLLYSIKKENNPTTGDGDIKELSVFPIDVDSKRSSGVSATKEELETSFEKRNEILEFFNDNGLEPIKAMSGNGYHLLIPLLHKVPVTDEIKDLFKDSGDILCAYFDGDQAIYNLARIWKLYGTMVCKGDHAPEIDRKHRRSRIDIPDEFERYDFHHICSVIAKLKTSERVPMQPLETSKKKNRTSTSSNNSNNSFSDVEKFISDNGIEVLDTSEGSAKTIYDIECPFCHNADASIVYMKTGDYWYFKCFHNSCSGKETKDFKKLFQADQTLEQTELPNIYVNEINEHGNLQERKANVIADEAMKHLNKADPNKIKVFMKDHFFGQIVEVTKKKKIDEGLAVDVTYPTFVEFNKRSMRGLLNRKMNFVKKSQKDGTITERMLMAPQDNICEDIIESQDKNNLPYLQTIVSHPTVTKDKKIINEPGYHEDDQLYLDGSKTVEIEDMTTEESYEILSKWLKDFPFKDYSDLMNAFALLITPFIRSALPYGELPPLFVIDANSQGAGKSLLAEALPTVVLGFPPGSSQLSSNEEEVRKRITSGLIDGDEVVIFDNTTGLISSNALATAVSQPNWKDRKLGYSETLEMEQTAMYVITANNAQTDADLTDRACWIRLDVDERVADRKFASDKFLSDTIRNRPKLFSAIYKWVKDWFDDGAKLGESNHRSRLWAKMTQGIFDSVKRRYNPEAEISLEGANIEPYKIKVFDQFLSNDDEQRQKSNPEFMALCKFRDEVLDEFGEDLWTVKDVMHLGSFTQDSDDTDLNLLGRWFKDKEGQAFHQDARSSAFAFYLKGKNGVVLTTHKLTMMGKKDRRNAFYFKRVKAEDDELR